MGLTDTLISKPPPIQQDDTGTLRVGGTRVTLDTVVGEFLDGHTAEEIATGFPSLKLEDVYATISYYLANRDLVNEYLSKRLREADDLQRKLWSEHPTSDLRARLMARAGRND